jgi:hypothetical protein
VVIFEVFHFDVRSEAVNKISIAPRELSRLSLSLISLPCCFFFFFWKGEIVLGSGFRIKNLSIQIAETCEIEIQV